MKRLLCLSFIISCLSFSSAAAHRVLYIGDSITDGGWGRSGGSAKASKDRNHTDLKNSISFLPLFTFHLLSGHNSV